MARDQEQDKIGAQLWVFKKAGTYLIIANKTRKGSVILQSQNNILGKSTLMLSYWSLYKEQDYYQNLW